LELILEKQNGKLWTGFNWLRTGTSGGLMWTRQWTFGFHKRRGISWVAEWLLASQKVVRTMEGDYRWVNIWITDINGGSGLFWVSWRNGGKPWIHSQAVYEGHANRPASSLVWYLRPNSFTSQTHVNRSSFVFLIDPR
jgi:hypothetical protein